MNVPPYLCRMFSSAWAVGVASRAIAIARHMVAGYLAVLLTSVGLRADYKPMAIERVSVEPQGVKLESTGATYMITHAGIQLIRRIDPATNTVKPRRVAEIKFEASIDNFRVRSQNKESASIESDAAIFDFNGDSLFFVTAKSPIEFTFTNAILNAPWNKGHELDRMWTDGYGGSLHASVSGRPTIVAKGEDFTRIHMTAGDRMAFMVFPPRPFDFESLYGRSSRPHVHFLANGDIDKVSTEEGIEPFVRNGFGAFTLWSVYNFEGDQSRPVLLDDGNMGYKLRDPEKIHHFVHFAHEHGFKVAPYIVFLRNPKWQYPPGHPKAGQFPEVSSTLAWMSRFRREYDFDGWYIDGAETGDFMTDYNFMRDVRKDIGDAGFLYYHNSIDPWGYNIGRQYRFAGLNAVFLNTYADYTLSGEMGELATVHTPNDAYYRFYTGGYGISQTYVSHKRKSYMDTAISEADNDRVIGENLNGTQRTRVFDLGPTWEPHFKAAYDRRKQEYLSGKFNPDVSWPIDPTTGWFRKPVNIALKAKAGTSVTITWRTQEPADSAVAYTHNGVWWPRSGAENEPRFKDGVRLPPPAVETGPDAVVEDAHRVTEHSITISDLNPETNYELKVRSSNGKPVPGEVVWQEIVKWRTGSGTFSRVIQQSDALPADQ
jgi:hypothetical protein